MIPHTRVPYYMFMGYYKMESEMLSYRQGATEVRDQLVEQLQKKLDKIGSENCSRRKQLNYWIRRILGVNSEKAKFTPEERSTLPK